MLTCFKKQCWDWQFDTSSHGTMVSNNLGRESKKYLNTNNIWDINLKRTKRIIN